jgi:uncharacterized membrane protein YdjX (TVP38/TMEM64 family)
MNEHRFKSQRRALPLLVGGAVLLAAGAFLLGVDDLYDFSASVQEAWADLQKLPAPVYFTVMALACILPLPISPFYVASGPLFGFETALLWIAPAIAANQLLTHGLADSVLRPWIERQLARRGHSVPKPRTKREQTLVTLLIRISPMPYSFQNWILGLSRIERLRYLAISWPIQMGYAAGWVLLGQSAFEGRFGIATVAVSLILCLALLARWGRGRLQTSRDGCQSASEKPGAH